MGYVSKHVLARVQMFVCAIRVCVSARVRMFVARQFMGLEIVSPAAVHAAHTTRRKQQFGKLLKPVCIQRDKSLLNTFLMGNDIVIPLCYFIARFAQLFVYICLTNVECLTKTKYFLTLEYIHTSRQVCS